MLLQPSHQIEQSLASAGAGPTGFGFGFSFSYRRHLSPSFSSGSQSESGPQYFMLFPNTCHGLQPSYHTSQPAGMSCGTFSHFTRGVVSMQSGGNDFHSTSVPTSMPISQPSCQTLQPSGIGSSTSSFS